MTSQARAGSGGVTLGEHIEAIISEDYRPPWPAASAACDHPNHQQHGGDDSTAASTATAGTHQRKSLHSPLYTSTPVNHTSSPRNCYSSHAHTYYTSQ